MPVQSGQIFIGAKTPGEADKDYAEQQARVHDTEARKLTLQMAVEQRKAQIEAARKKQQTDAFLADAMKRHTNPNNGLPDLDAVVGELFQHDPDRALELQKHTIDTRAKIVDSGIKHHQLEKLNIEADNLLLERMVDDGTFQAFRGRVSPDLQKALGEQFNPELIGKLMREVPDERARLDNIVKLLGKNPGEALPLSLAGADSPEEWAGVWQGFAMLGVKPKEIEALQQLYGKDFTPEGLQRVREQVVSSDRPATLGSFEDYVGRKFGANPTPQQIEQARKAYNQADDRPQGVGVQTLSPTSESNIVNRLTNQWAAAKKPAEELERQASLMKVGMDAARRGDLAQGSQAVLVTFQKILDPTSVVRESEYDRSAAGQSLMNRVAGAMEQLARGGAGIRLGELEKFHKLAEEAVKAQTNAYLRATRERVGRTADRYNIPREIVFEDVDVTTGTTPKLPPPPNQDVPEAVRNTLASIKDGIHTLRDGSVWEKRGNTITRIK